jgi:coenzyme F420 biosynthesis associated uncharacterized protein
MVDWSLARRIARLSSADGAPVDLGVDLAGWARSAEAAVSEYSGLTLAAPAPPVREVSRADWVDANLSTLAELLDPVAGRLEGRMERAGPLAGALRLGAQATLAAEAGLVMGFVSQRVLAQYDLSLLAPEPDPSLLFVSRNLDNAVRRLDVDRESFLAWVVTHEMTHVFQFQGVPWLRDHLGGLLREYLETVEVRIERGAAGGLPSLPDVSKLVSDFREGGLAALVQSREQREILARVQAAMSVIEGYSDHVMDALAPQLVPKPEGLREAMERRRASKSAPERIIERLLGLDMKLRQYELGARFCAAVVEAAGVDALNRVWESPESLPTTRELDHPDEWLVRIGSSEPAAA